jgi:hypothetical protein
MNDLIMLQLCWIMFQNAIQSIFVMGILFLIMIIQAIWNMELIDFMEIIKKTALKYSVIFMFSAICPLTAQFTVLLSAANMMIFLSVMLVQTFKYYDTVRVLGMVTYALIVILEVYKNVLVCNKQQIITTSNDNMIVLKFIFIVVINAIKSIPILMALVAHFMHFHAHYAMNLNICQYTYKWYEAPFYQIASSIVLFASMIPISPDLSLVMTFSIIFVPNYLYYIQQSDENTILSKLLNILNIGACVLYSLCYIYRFADDGRWLIQPSYDLQDICENVGLFCKA